MAREAVLLDQLNSTKFLLGEAVLIDSEVIGACVNVPYWSLLLLRGKLQSYIDQYNIVSGAETRIARQCVQQLITLVSTWFIAADCSLGTIWRKI